MFHRIVNGYKMPPIQWSTPASCTKDLMLENNCPCDTSDPLVIICESRQFYRIPPRIKQTVYKLRMSSNHIRSLNYVSWPIALKKLVLEDNELTRLDNNTFLQAPNLEGLFLQDNRIGEIELDAFRGTSKLTRLVMHNNQLSELNLDIFRHTKRLTHLDLSYNKIEFVDHLEFRRLESLIELNLNGNLIQFLGSEAFSFIPKIQSLSLEDNRIDAIPDFAFYNSSQMTELNLSRNKLHNLTRNVFVSLTRLKKLDLSRNLQLDELQNDTFRELTALKSLDLSGVPLKNLQKSWFSYLDLKFIYFSRFDFCFYASKARVCSPHSDGISTGSQLVLSEFKYYVWAIATVCCLGNLFVFAWRSPQEDQSLSLIVRNLSIADLMMGLYLVAVGWKNEHFGNTYGAQAIDWIQSPHCTLMGFTAILSSELSLSIIFIITIERYRSITSLVHLERVELRQRARNLLAYAWLAAISIALIPLGGWLLQEKIHIYGNNGLCLPLYIDNPFNKGWQYSAIVYLGINFAAVMIILGLYVRMYLIIMSVRKKTRPVRTMLASNERQREDVTLALRFLFIVVADCLCWIPIVVIKFCALIGLRVTNDIYCWLVVFILPINSALNPIIYTIGTPSYLRTVLFNKIIRCATLITNFLQDPQKPWNRILQNVCQQWSSLFARCCPFKNRSGSSSKRVILSKKFNSDLDDRTSTSFLRLHQRSSCDSATSESSSVPNGYIMQTYLGQHQQKPRNSTTSAPIEEERLLTDLKESPPQKQHVAIHDQLCFIDSDEEQEPSRSSQQEPKKLICELNLRPNVLQRLEQVQLLNSLDNKRRDSFTRDYLCKFDESFGRTEHEIIGARPMNSSLALDTKPQISRSWLIRATSNKWRSHLRKSSPASRFKCKNVNCARTLASQDLIEVEDELDQQEVVGGEDVDIVELAAECILGVGPDSGQAEEPQRKGRDSSGLLCNSAMDKTDLC